MALIDEYNEIMISHGSGSLEGYVVNSDMENLDNWFADRNFSDELLAKIRKQYRRVAILRNLFVRDEERGKGHGTAILSDAMEQSGLLGAEVILLEADTGENNPFDLVEWYEAFGFEILEGDKLHYPLMMFVI